MLGYYIKIWIFIAYSRNFCQPQSTIAASRDWLKISESSDYVTAQCIHSIFKKKILLNLLEELNLISWTSPSVLLLREEESSSFFS